MIIQAFYNGVTQVVRSTIDAAVGGTLMSKIEDEAYNLIEEMALNNFQWSSERAQPRRVGGKLEVAFTLLFAKVHAMTQRLNQLNVNVANSSASSPCEICCSIEHISLHCPVRSPLFHGPDQVNYITLIPII